MAVGRIARAEQHAASPRALRVNLGFLISASDKATGKAWLAITGILNTVASVCLMSTAANKAVSFDMHVSEVVFLVLVSNISIIILIFFNGLSGLLLILGRGNLSLYIDKI